MKAILCTILLLTLSTGLQAEPLTKEQNQQAWELFTSLGCRACHDINHSGSNLAVSLDRIGLKQTEETILLRLQTAHDENKEGGKFMPSFQTTPLEQLELLSRFLANRK